MQELKSTAFFLGTQHDLLYNQKAWCASGRPLGVSAAVPGFGLPARYMHMQHIHTDVIMLHAHTYM